MYLQYRLYKDANNDTSNVLKEVLKNRGIDDHYTYMNLDESVVIPYQNLDNIDEAVALFMRHFNEKNKIGVLVDEDPDGFCSASMMYSYIKKMDEDYPVEYILHTRAKAHGLTSDVIIPNDIELLIIPDAGTNDKNEIKRVNQDAIDILILDHHELEEKYTEDDLMEDDAIGRCYYKTIIVNNQMSDNYSNKSLCGAGVVYRFLQALDEENWNEFADDYLDLCALANISDVMDMRSYETRYLTDLGLLNVKNKCFQALIDAQNYSMNGKVNIHNVQWYITPILNGMIRIGSQEEKELLFRAFIEQDEFFEYKKRATKDKPSETIQESIYDRAARLCKNAKSRQDKQKEKSVETIAEIAQSIPFDDKVVMIDTSDILDSGLTGVVAIKIAEMFNKPCILLNKILDKETGKITYGDTFAIIIKCVSDKVSSKILTLARRYSRSDVVFGCATLLKTNPRWNTTCVCTILVKNLHSSRLARRNILANKAQTHRTHLEVGIKQCLTMEVDNDRQTTFNIYTMVYKNPFTSHILVFRCFQSSNDNIVYVIGVTFEIEITIVILT